MQCIFQETFVQLCNTVLRKDKHGQFSDRSLLPDLRKTVRLKRHFTDFNSNIFENVLYKIKMFEIESVTKYPTDCPVGCLHYAYFKYI